MDKNEKWYVECEEIARKIRINCIEMTHKQGTVGAHIGGSLSLAEIMSVLYGGVLNLGDSNDELHDRLIISKGHGVMAQYAAMKEVGILTEVDLATFKKNDSFLSAHPTRNLEMGFDFASGSLGQGLSLGVGCCLGLRRKENIDTKVYVILGDGECDEGSVWEAAQSASHFSCNNLVAIVDYNHLQYDGEVETVMKLQPFTDRWKSFGWDVELVNGHDVRALYKAMTLSSDRPKVIIADTIKGKGISFMENNPLWHNHALDDEQYAQALIELGGCNEV